jgi:RimJ/RimL family protein N-acetyltransferase
MRLVYDDDARVCAWVDEQMGLPWPSIVKTAIGCEIEGELVAGVVFDNLTDNNVFAHCVNLRSGGFPVELLAACYAYVFDQLGLERVSLLVAASNERALRFVEKWGAQFEARLARATKAADMLIYVMWRDTEPAAQVFRAAERA